MPLNTLAHPTAEALPKRAPESIPSPRQSHDSSPAPTSGADWIKLARELGTEWKKTAADRERRLELPRKELQVLRELGFGNLLIPKKFGGQGLSFRDAAHVVIELSKGDPNMGSILCFHLYVSALPRLFDFIGDGERFDRAIAENKWLWSKAHTSRNIKEFTARPLPDGGFLLNGRKEWVTAATLADITTVIAYRTDRDELLFAYLPIDRPGLTFHNDWDHLGLRLTETVTIDFHDVKVSAEEVIPSTHQKPIRGYPRFYGILSSLFVSATNLGAALGSVEQGRDYTRNITRSRRNSGVESATKDPYILADYGDFWIKLQAGLALLDQYAGDIQAAYARRREITDREFGELQAKGSALRIYSTRTGLDITARIYEVTGAGASANRHGFDQYWRDIRILSLHSPLIYVAKGLGNYALNDEAPGPINFI